MPNSRTTLAPFLRQLVVVRAVGRRPHPHHIYTRAAVSRHPPFYSPARRILLESLQTDVDSLCLARIAPRAVAGMCVGLQTHVGSQTAARGGPLVRTKAAFGHAPLGCFHCDFFCKSGGLAAALGGFRCRGYFQLVRHGRRLNRNAPDSRASHTAS